MWGKLLFLLAFSIICLRNYTFPRKKILQKFVFRKQRGMNFTVTNKVVNKSDGKQGRTQAALQKCS